MTGVNKKLIRLIIPSLLALVILCSCEPSRASYRPNGWARVTFYHPHEIDKVRVHGRWRKVCYGRHTSSGVKARQAVTVAAPSWVPIGTKVIIPRLRPVLGADTFQVQDRGGGEKRFGPNWFDVFVNNKSTMNRLSYSLPEWMEYQLR